MPRRGELPGGELQSPFFRGMRAHQFVIDAAGNVVRITYWKSGGGAAGVTHEFSRLETGHDGLGHDTEYVLMAHNRAHDNGNEEEIISTEPALPQAIVLEHQKSGY